MTTITIDADNANEIEEIKAIAKEKGWRIRQSIVSNYTPSTADEAKQKRMQEILKQGIGTSSFGDASEWQREIRKDRELPGEGNCIMILDSNILIYAFQPPYFFLKQYLNNKNFVSGITN
jgi:hypothetical protein